MDPEEHFLPISGLRKGDVIASAEQNEQGGIQLGWAMVVCLLAFELRDPQMLVVTNGVTMNPPLSSEHAEGGDGETTWVYTCVTTPPSHLIARGPLCRHDNMALLPFNDVYIPTLQRAERQPRNEQWKLLQIGRAQGRQVQAYEQDKMHHKGFLADLEFIGAFGENMMAWGPGALKISSRGNPTFDMTAYTPCDRTTLMPPVPPEGGKKGLSSRLLHARLRRTAGC